MLELLVRLTFTLGAGLLVTLCVRRSPARIRVAILRTTLVVGVVCTALAITNIRVGIPVGATAIIEIPQPRSTQTLAGATERVMAEHPRIEAAPHQAAKAVPTGAGSIRAGSIKAGPSQIVATQDQSAVRFGESAPTLWSLTWAIGGALMVLSFATSLVRLSRLRRGAQPVALSNADAAFALVGVRQQVSLGQSAQLGTALTFGLFRHVVLVPTEFQTWASDLRKAVLFHEAAHIRRFDCAWHWFAIVFRAVFWFHPLAWILAWAHRDESEMAADEFAIASGVPALDYADALVSVARFSSNRGFVRSQGALTMSQQRLGRRVTAALQPQRGFSTVGALALTLLVSGFGAIAGVVQVQPAQAPESLHSAQPNALPPVQDPTVAVAVRAKSTVQIAPTMAPPARASTSASAAKPFNVTRVQTMPRVATIESRSQRIARLKAVKASLLARRNQLRLSQNDPEIRRLEAEVAQLREQVARLEQRQASRSGADMLRGGGLGMPPRSSAASVTLPRSADTPAATSVPSLPAGGGFGGSDVGGAAAGGGGTDANALPPAPTNAGGGAPVPNVAIATADRVMMAQPAAEARSLAPIAVVPQRSPVASKISRLKPGKPLKKAKPPKKRG